MMESTQQISRAYTGRDGQYGGGYRPPNDLISSLDHKLLSDEDFDPMTCDTDTLRFKIQLMMGNVHTLQEMIPQLMTRHSGNQDLLTHLASLRLYDHNAIVKKMSEIERLRQETSEYEQRVKKKQRKVDNVLIDYTMTENLNKDLTKQEKILRKRKTYLEELEKKRGLNERILTEYQSAKAMYSHEKDMYEKTQRSLRWNKNHYKKLEAIAGQSDYTKSAANQLSPSCDMRNECVASDRKDTLPQINDRLLTERGQSSPPFNDGTDGAGNINKIELPSIHGQHSQGMALQAEVDTRRDAGYMTPFPGARNQTKPSEIGHLNTNMSNCSLPPIRGCHVPKPPVQKKGSGYKRVARRVKHVVA